MTAPFPLVVDLDGTLIATDMLHESALAMVRDHPHHLFRLPFWLSRGKAYLKAQLTDTFRFDAAALPYHADFVDWLREQRAAGRSLVLCTASDQRIADAVAVHLGLFDEAVGSDGRHNLAGAAKGKWLVERFGPQGFDYAGNSAADLAVWTGARHAVLVNTPRKVSQTARERFSVEREFAGPKRGWRAVRRVLRIHQWLKNVLLLVPLVAAHQIRNIEAWGSLLLAFAAFSLCASTVYIANDLLDLESDRLHPRKRMRPFAAGVVPTWVGVVAAPLLLAVSAAIAVKVGAGFAYALALYFLLTCAYSWGLKRIVLVDCVTLAMLYTLRVIAGAAAIRNVLSFWLLAFCVFLFLSLAFVKRYAELAAQAGDGRSRVHGRGYFTTDAPLVQSFGVASAFSAVMVLALYLDSEAVRRLYRTPETVWACVPVLLFWVSRMWLKAHRGEMDDDPLVFAVKDPVSLLAGGVFGLALALGTVGWPT